MESESHPGVIDTPIWTKQPTSAGSNAPIDPNEVARAGVPLGRAGQAQDHRERRALPRFRRCPATWPALSWWSMAAWQAAQARGGA